MNKQTERLISADKLLEYINGSPLGYANDNFIESLELKINIGQFAPDPIPLPTLKPGDKVRHKDHEQWGIGKVLELSKSKKTGMPLYGRSDDPEYCSGYDPADNAGGGKSEKLF